MVLGFCLILALGGLGIAAWVVASGNLLSLDGLLLELIALVFVAVFGGMVGWSFHKGEAQAVLGRLRKGKDASGEQD